MPQLSFTTGASRRRRLLDWLASNRLDAAVITDARDVYYFTGALLPNDLPVALILASDETSLLVGPAEHPVDSVDRHVVFEWNHRGTRHPDPVSMMVQALADTWQPPTSQRLAVQPMSLLQNVAHILERLASERFAALDEPLAAMQRRKDADEVELIRASVRANLGAYAAVQEAICPGANELDVLSAGRRGSTTVAGEKVFHDGDYQCGEYNGPARNRKIEAGELYIVDAWTCYRGYWSDMSRTFAVGTPPTDVQHALFNHIRWVLAEAGKLLRPGIDGTEVYRSLDEMIRQHPPLVDTGLIHHGGHAIGLRAHEMPDINLKRGGKLEPGNVICIEPGGYLAAARYGVRLENMYLITDSGCEDLCPGPVELFVCH